MNEIRLISKKSFRPPLIVRLVAALIGLSGVAAFVYGIYLTFQSPTRLPAFQVLPTAMVVSILVFFLAWGIWTLQDWARIFIMLILTFAGIFYAAMIIFQGCGVIFGGEHILSVGDIFKVVLWMLSSIVFAGFIPVAILYGLSKTSHYFAAHPRERKLVDQVMRYLLLGFAFSAIIVVLLIIIFTLNESLDAIEKIGLNNMLVGTIWRPGGVVGNEEGLFGLVPMVVGSILSTLGAVILGVPISIGMAILLAEIAPNTVREILRPGVELLAGIPSVVYGLFGMVVLAPMIRTIKLPYNSGFGILNASIILAIMIMPTVTSVAEDAIRAVPKMYKEGSLAVGSTHWQTIWEVILPAARSGIIAAIILGIGRALGETMAIIMVIGNSIAIPTPLNDNPLTIFLSTARTLTGNIAVEINYAAGPHRSALFFTGVLLFIMIFIVNNIARYLMREKMSSH